MKPIRSSNEWFKGAFILTVGALITKILSAVYRIPFQNIVGDIGFYIYQQVYPFYGLALVLSTYGFPVIISKQLSEFKEKRQTDKIFRFMALSFCILTGLGFLSFLFLYFGSSWLAEQMDDPNLAILLKVTSVAFLIFPVVAVLRGYFQGMGNMIPTAVSQVGEQVIRVFTILTIAILFTKEGLSLYMVGGGAAFGSITGGLISILILIQFFLRNVNGSIWLHIWNKQLLADLGKVLKLLLLQGFAVCISGMVFIFMQLADSLTMLSLLVDGGMEHEAAKVMKGVYDRGQPLIQLGTVVATSMSLSLVPIISSERIKKSGIILQGKIRLALQISIVIGVAATVGLISIIQPTNEMLFENQEGSTELAVLTVMIILSSITLTITAILQGLGVMFFPAWIISLSFALKYGLNTILIPSNGAIGAALATNISMTIGLIFLWWKLKRIMKGPLLPGWFFIKVGIAALSMFVLLKVYLSLTEPLFHLMESHRLVAAMQSLSGVAIGGLLYLVVIMRLKIFRIEDLGLLPFGSKLMYLLPRERSYNRGK